MAAPTRSSGSWTNVSGYGAANVPASTRVPPCQAVAGALRTPLTMPGPYRYSVDGIRLQRENWLAEQTSGSTAGGVWTYIAAPSNSNVGQNNSIYGALGVTGTGNYPGGRQTAVLWADNNGNLWLFGGLGLDSAGNFESWRYWKSSRRQYSRKARSLTTSGNTISLLNLGLGCPVGVPLALLTNRRLRFPTGSSSQILRDRAGDPPVESDSDGNLWFFGGSGLCLIACAEYRIP